MPPAADPADLSEAWIRGVAANPAAPPDVLLRLLDPAGAAAWKVLCGQRPLPPEAVEAVLAHPDRAVRRAFACNGSADPADRGRLAADPDDLVRITLASGPGPRPAIPRPLPDAAIEALLAEDPAYRNERVTAAEIRAELFSSRQASKGFLRGLLHHRDPALRAHASWGWYRLSPEEREALLTDPDPGVREAARAANWTEIEVTPEEVPEHSCHARTDRLTNCPLPRSLLEDCLTSRRDLPLLAHNPHTPPDAVARLAHDADPRVRETVARRDDLDPAVVAELARDPDPAIREQIAGYPDLDPALLAELERDPDGDVRTRARLRPRATTAQHRGRIDTVVGRSAEEIGSLGEWIETQDLAWLAACAVSADPVMRRAAAISAPDLPTGLAKALAQDSDADVRHLVAYHDPAASPSLLLEAFVAGPRQRAFLLGLPAFPRTGLAGLLAHPDPEVRALAAGDPTLAEPPVAQLSDADPRVRRAAAANPLQSRERIAALLDDPELAEAAAANPGLAEGMLHELLDQAAIPRRSGG